MSHTLIRDKVLPFLGLGLALPAFFFAVASLFESSGYPALSTALEPYVTISSLDQPMGANINFLILFGPVLAFVLNVLTVLHIRFDFTKEKFDCRLSIAKNWLNLAVVFLSILILVFFSIHAIDQNCNCTLN